MGRVQLDSGLRGGVALQLCRSAIVAAVGLSLVACSPSSDSRESDSQPTSTGGTVTIYLTRHGETMLNELDRVQGWSDSPLTDSGIEDAEDLGNGLREENINFGAAYSADTLRQYETASRALETADLELDIVRDERLREMAFGPYEGAKNKTMWDEIAQDQGYEDQEALDDDMDNVGFLNAVESIPTVAGNSDLTVESCTEVGDRALEALEDIATEQQTEGSSDVLVVSSGITIMCLLDELDADLTDVSGIDNAAVNELHYDDGVWAVETINDTSYVETGATN